MSINQFSRDFPETLWWAHQQHQQSFMEPNPTTTQQALIPSLTSSSWPIQEQNRMFFSTQNPSVAFNLNHEEGDEEHDQEEQDKYQQQSRELHEQVEKEQMFEKPLTPSDVGKLNRLVIPKQHAEKYFPLGGDSVDKGLLLSFEDELGKCWRFRYSYWNSSQSYVLTKGWSRYVKEKRLDAGDVVLFERHRLDGERLFIGWRRRGENSNTSNNNNSSSSCSSGMMVHSSSGGAWSRGLYSQQQHHQNQPYQHGHGANVTIHVPYHPYCLHAGSSGQNPTTIPIGNPKRLRLFGVNLECQPDDSEPSTPDGSSMSSHGPINQHLFYGSHSPYSSSNSSQSHMDMTFSRDLNQTTSRRG